ncbi:neurotensin receptor type 2 [Rhinatrema bivittatum]|uniref:neurotensin receptor type 2 n=1 Tax=Rhinatrema bivittatum TaxID=194408 RepID=UPI00112DBBF6|nr:neurotensin receptor type 2 [Rhinatrema bivittatum]
MEEAIWAQMTLEKRDSREQNLSLPTIVPNFTGDPEDLLRVNTHLSSKILFTILYAIIFLVGIIGNVLTIYLVLKKQSMQNLQGTAHYHLVSLALSDILILLISIPIELYNFIWVHYPWLFGDLVCRSYYFLRDICSHATVLNIASLSCERYLAICHPIRAKRIMSKKRTKKLLSLIWLSSLGFSLPMAFIMGVKYESRSLQDEPDPSLVICTALVRNATLKIFIQVNVLVSFLMPLSLVAFLNYVTVARLEALCSRTSAASIKIPLPTRKTSQTAIPGSTTSGQKKQLLSATGSPSYRKDSLMVSNESHRIQALQHSIIMLRAIVIAYVVCWLPYHARRLMFCYVPDADWTNFLFTFYHYFYMLTNTLFYISSAVNPVLYNVVSSSFRKLFFEALASPCREKEQTTKLHMTVPRSQSIKSNLTTISSQTSETIY